MLRTTIRRIALASALTSTLLSAGVAAAQDVALPEPALPTAAPTNKNGEPEIALDADKQIDLSNIVTSAAKGVTTVQEAPAIINVITAQEIKERGYQFLDQALATIPGWLNATELGNQVSIPMVRGTLQAVLLLHDGISEFEPWANTPMMGHSQPLENLKRIEVVTGPGGVLWGANSFLGIVNLITKDAEDVNGLEVNAGYGDGRGDRQDFKTYALFGKTFFHNRLKIFQHISYENYIGPTYAIPQIIAASSAPNPIGQTNFGTVAEPYPDRTQQLTVDGKYTFGPLSLYYSVPFGDDAVQMTFANTVVPHDQWTTRDKYGVLEYKDRFFHDKMGITAKGYYTRFDRDLNIQILPESPLFPGFTNPDGTPHYGGLEFQFRHNIARYGGTLDMDFNLPFNLRLLAGGEAFYEGVTGATLTFQSPKDVGELPFLCPVNPDGTLVPTCPRQLVYDTNRIVGALYADAQWRPLARLTLDGGVRLQQGFGNRPYKLTPLYSGAVVWNFFRNYHAKATYATGFRAPTLNATDAAAGALEYGADPNLFTESSQAFQGELNGKFLRDTKRVRELEVRLDYAYTYLNDLIQIEEGKYGNVGKRAINSVEGYAKLYLVGDHYLQASYTYLHTDASDVGVMRNMPSQWFTVGGVFSLIHHVLELNATLNIMGSYQDPNRYPSIPNPLPGATTAGKTTDLTFDQLTPVALLQLGARAHFFRNKVDVNAQFYNVLDQHYWYPDGFYDLVPSVEMTPTPAPGFNFFASVSYHIF